MPVRLVSVSSGNSIKLDKPVVLIGRNPDCDVVLTKSRKVSRAHCVVASVNNHILVRDLGSTNGVWINGQRVERESRLRLGDELSVADVLYQLLNVESGEENGHSKKKPKDSRRKNIVATNQPVPLPDEDDSFVVEATAPRLRRVTPAQIAAAKRADAERADDDSSCDVIPLDEKMLAQPSVPDGLVPLEIPDTGSEIEQPGPMLEAARGLSDGEFRMQAEDEGESEEVFSILDSVDESDDIVPLSPIDED
jgi:pSer/pThr/pTyr-binding forkhead associated (FHA) protein